MYHYIFIVGMGVVCCAACIPVVVWFLRGCQDTPGKLCELLDFRNYLIHFIQTDGRMDGQMAYGETDGKTYGQTDGHRLQWYKMQSSFFSSMAMNTG